MPSDQDFENAVINGDLAALEQLTSGGVRPPTAALTRAAVRRRPDIAKRLLELGADPNGPTSQWSPLAWAVLYDVEITKLYIDAGADVDHIDDGKTPLQRAVEDGGAKCIAAARVLIASGCKVPEALLVPLASLGLIDDAALVEKARAALAGEVVGRWTLKKIDYDDGKSYSAKKLGLADSLELRADGTFEETFWGHDDRGTWRVDGGKIVLASGAAIAFRSGALVRPGKDEEHDVDYDAIYERKSTARLRASRT